MNKIKTKTISQIRKSSLSPRRRSSTELKNVYRAGYENFAKKHISKGKWELELEDEPIIVQMTRQKNMDNNTYYLYFNKKIPNYY